MRRGEVIATVDGDGAINEICAPCDAWVMDYLAHDGERLEPGSAIVHLRAICGVRRDGDPRRRPIAFRMACSRTPISRRALDTTDEWIVTRTGIRERRIAARRRDDVDVRDRRGGRGDRRTPACSPDDLDMVIVATCTPD